MNNGGLLWPFWAGLMARSSRPLILLQSKIYARCAIVGNPVTSLSSNKRTKDNGVVARNNAQSNISLWIIHCPGSLVQSEASSKGRQCHE